MSGGVILKALSGFYYVDAGDGKPLVTCKARGRLRHEKITPLVGDRVAFTPLSEGGIVDEILPRKNEFQRPAVANIDQLVIIVSGAVPVTDPFLVDRMVSLAEWKDCEPVVCINKCDLDAADMLYETYRKAGITTLRVSAETGEGLSELYTVISEKVSAFTGNSGVGKSSILNALEPEFALQVGEVSDKQIGRAHV